MGRALSAAISLAAGLLWAIAVVQDLKRRRVSVFVLAGLALLALGGRTWAAPSPRAWAWWVLSATALLWPLRHRRQATFLALLAFICGLVFDDPGAGLALGGGVLAWALGWWGGADGVALAVLGLRYGVVGMLGGLLLAALVAAVLMLVRGQSWSLVAALSETLSASLRVHDGDIPAEREMPAAAVLAAAGILLEVITLWRVFG